MSPAQVSAVVAQCNGTYLEKLTVLLGALAEIDDMPGFRAPRCGCGADLMVLPGRHTGFIFIRHPRLAPKLCPRVGYAAHGPDAPKAWAAYMASAPDLGALDALPPDEEEPAPDDFSCEA